MLKIFCIDLKQFIHPVRVAVFLFIFHSINCHIRLFELPANLNMRRRPTFGSCYENIDLNSVIHKIGDFQAILQG